MQKNIQEQPKIITNHQEPSITTQNKIITTKNCQEPPGTTKNHQYIPQTKNNQTEPERTKKNQKLPKELPLTTKNYQEPPRSNTKNH